MEKDRMELIAESWTRWTGSSVGFFLALTIILLWLTTGPICHFCDTWQLVINTTTTIVTFLMVFLIQRTMNKEMQTIHLKLNELIAAHKGASNRLINAEDFSEQEVEMLRKLYAKLASKAKGTDDRTAMFTIEEAEDD